MQECLAAPRVAVSSTRLLTTKVSEADRDDEDNGPGCGHNVPQPHQETGHVKPLAALRTKVTEGY